MQAPDFWQDRTLFSEALRPLAAGLSGLGQLRHALIRPARVPVPVICVGNLVAGGAGKTPTAIALAGLLRERAAVGFLTRGYRGRLKGPVAVEPARHDFRAVGDEALLLHAVAPTFVARDRVAGARFAVDRGIAALILDDGFQNPHLHKDLSVIVVDGASGLGNGRLLPAGPLRETVRMGSRRAAAAIVVGEPRDGLLAELGPYLPVVRARLEPVDPPARWVGRALLAFAGIGRPQKFFDSLAAIGAAPQLSIGFPDHWAFRRDQVEALIAEARRSDLTLVTTAKDWVRLPADLRPEIEMFGVRLVWQEPADELRIRGLIETSLARFG